MLGRVKPGFDSVSPILANSKVGTPLSGDHAGIWDPLKSVSAKVPSGWVVDPPATSKLL